MNGIQWHWLSVQNFRWRGGECWKSPTLLQSSNPELLIHELLCTHQTATCYFPASRESFLSSDIEKHSFISTRLGSRSFCYHQCNDTLCNWMRSPYFSFLFSHTVFILGESHHIILPNIRFFLEDNLKNVSVWIEHAMCFLAWRTSVYLIPCLTSGCLPVKRPGAARDRWDVQLKRCKEDAVMIEQFKDKGRCREVEWKWNQWCIGSSLFIWAPSTTFQVLKI